MEYPFKYLRRSFASSQISDTRIWARPETLLTPEYGFRGSQRAKNLLIRYGNVIYCKKRRQDGVDILLLRVLILCTRNFISISLAAATNAFMCFI